MKRAKTASILLLAMITIFPVIGSAGNCRNVDITIENNTGGEIKIKKIWHYDFGKGKWRTNSTTNKRVANNGEREYRKDLQYVKGERTQIAVYYHQYDINYDRWAYSPTFTCHKGDDVLVDIDEPGTMAIFERPPLEGRPAP